MHYTVYTLSAQRLESVVRQRTRGSSGTNARDLFSYFFMLTPIGGSSVYSNYYNTSFKLLPGTYISLVFSRIVHSFNKIKRFIGDFP